jgi:hypothetical protein
MDTIFTLSEGYPHFIQQAAYCAFDCDTDGRIDKNDVLEGIFSESGALAQLGKRYFSQWYFDQIFSDNYREVLGVLARARTGEEKKVWVSKSEIRKESGLPDSQVSNAIKALRDRKIILAKKGTRGVYSLPSLAFAVWIRSIELKEPG